MIWIFPMAGRGKRTQELGEFKPFIIVDDKLILEWLITGIKQNLQQNDKLVFITTDYFEERYLVTQTISTILEKYGIKNEIIVHTIREILDGPAKTIYEAREYYRNDEQVTICNTDQFVVIDLKRSFESENHIGYIPIYLSRNPKSSFVNLDGNTDKITQIKEKEQISNYASSGIYYFRTGKLLIQALEKMFRDQIMVNNEYYIGPAINYLLSGEKYFKAQYVQVKYDLGNTESINKFHQLTKCFRGDADGL
ncbi:MAG: hypothetical protein HQ506_02180 [Candidatus Marinimicrobia bacterium]|nr:hypothetical protein [Candidatus Neomarinimicrobiota bacterium]